MYNSFKTIFGSGVKVIQTELNKGKEISKGDLFFVYKDKSDIKFGFESDKFISEYIVVLEVSEEYIKYSVFYFLNSVTFDNYNLSNLQEDSTKTSTIYSFSKQYSKSKLVSFNDENLVENIIIFGEKYINNKNDKFNSEVFNMEPVEQIIVPIEVFNNRVFFKFIEYLDSDIKQSMPISFFIFTFDFLEPLEETKKEIILDYQI